MATMTYREALNLALSEEMRRDDRVFVIGDAVGLNDGADEMTQRLLNEFDPRRVVQTHIAESGFTGVGIGAAMVGLRPVVEMMTFNLVMLALDQIVRTAAKLYYVSGGQYNVPIVIRGRGDPVHQFAVQHSQSMERYFFNVPGLKVVCPSSKARCPKIPTSRSHSVRPSCAARGATSPSSPTSEWSIARWRRPRSSRRTRSPWRSWTQGRSAP
jgi:pyruvate dehydrogenase E1 component beta subunit